VPTITLTDFRDAEGIRKIGLRSIDIELHEPMAVKGFDIKRFKPALVCTGALPPVRQQILDYFAKRTATRSSGSTSGSTWRISTSPSRGLTN
jgi:hypothetical protein